MPVAAIDKSVPSKVRLDSAVIALVPVPVNILLSVNEDAPVPPFATDKSVPLQSPLLIASVPPNVRLPDDVTVPVNVNPFTVPVVPTDVTVPALDVQD